MWEHTFIRVHAYRSTLFWFSFILPFTKQPHGAILSLPLILLVVFFMPSSFGILNRLIFQLLKQQSIWPVITHLPDCTLQTSLSKKGYPGILVNHYCLCIINTWRMDNLPVRIGGEWAYLPDGALPLPWWLHHPPWVLMQHGAFQVTLMDGPYGRFCLHVLPSVR